jgi:hypothetical protein
MEKPKEKEYKIEKKIRQENLKTNSLKNKLIKNE